jgi:hypothetical protein
MGIVIGNRIGRKASKPLLDAFPITVTIRPEQFMPSSIHIATGQELDIWASFYKLGRKDAEPDHDLRLRIREAHLGTTV